MNHRLVRTAVAKVPATLLLLFSMSLIEIRVSSALKLLAFVWLIVRLGLRIIRNAGIVKPTFAMAFAVGSALTVFTIQILLSSGLGSGTTHFVITLILLLIASKDLWYKDRLNTDHSQIDIFLQISIGLLVFSLWQFWALPYSASLLLWFVYVKPLKHRYLVNGLGTSGLFVSWAVSRALRPENWTHLFQGNDSQFFESMSWTTSTWGLHEHPGFLGGSLTDYHWFSYAFLGSLSHVASLPPWDAILKIGPILVFSLTASCLTRGIAGLSRVQAHVLLIVSVLAIRTTETIRFDSYSFSIVIGLVVLQIAENVRSWSRSFPVMFMFAIIYVQLAFCKVSTFIVISSILVLYFIDKEHRKHPSTWPVVVLMMSIAIALYALFFRRSNNSSVLIASVTSPATRSEILTVLASPLTAVSTGFIILYIFSCFHTPKHQREVTLWAIGLVPIWLAYQVVFASGTSGYFGSAAISFGFLMTIPELVPKVQRIVGQKTFLIGALTLLPVGVIGGGAQSELAGLISELIDQVTTPASSLNFVLANNGPFLLVLILSASVVLSVKRHRTFTLFLAVITCVGIFAGSTFRNYWVIRNSDDTTFTASLTNSSPFGSDALALLGTYIQKHVPQNAVFASNNFCCFSTDWWGAVEENPSAYLENTPEEIRWGGANYLLPAYTRRRFLIQGLRFQSGYGLPSHEQMSRMRTSLDFANNPSVEVAERLKAYGVSYFVTNLALTDVKNWRGLADEVIRQGDFLLLKLK